VTESKWKRKARALSRLAENQRGKPEGDLARQKLLEIINAHPEAKDYEPVKELIRRDLAMKDVMTMKKRGIPLEGDWTGRNLFEAIALMETDYKRRIAEADDCERLATPAAQLPA